MIVHKHFQDPVFLARIDRQLHSVTSGREKIEHVAVFTVGDLSDHTPSNHRQQPVATTNTLGANTPVYSTGKLEAALAAGYEVWVVTSKVGFDASDVWWQKYVPAERSFALLDRSEDTAYPWFRLMFALITKLAERKRPSKLNQADACDSVFTIKATIIRWGVVLGENFKDLSSGTP